MDNGNQIKKIKILCCGGTIDKIYFDAKSSHQVGDPAVGDILRRAKVVLANAESILRKDSLDMTDDDRQMIRAKVQAESAGRILITHGTDTMTQTANTLAAANLDKTVVLTGAFSPAIFRDTDAEFNAGFALAAAMLLPTGIYIAMNGQVFSAGAVRKNRQDGRFESA